MAHHLHYTCTFQNRITENIRIELYKKDVEAEQVESLKAVNFRQSYPKGEGDKFDPIIASEITFEIWLRTGDNVEFYDFLVTFQDEWKVIAYSDSQTIFVGFLTPGEGWAEFQSKPYSVTLNAVDGLGLLKNIPLTDINGDDFTGINLISDYLAAIFSKTGCDLPIRMYGSWIEESGTGRITNPNKDTFNQYGLHKRTFLDEKVEFFNCYECLRRICEETYSVYQWQGRWVVLNIGEMQANPGPRIWYTDYDSAGSVTGSGQMDENPCPIGLDLIIHPRDRSHSIGSLLSIKSAKHRYNYIPPPELLNNQDLARLGPFIGPLSGSTWTAYDIVGWTAYEGNPSNEAPYSGPATDPFIRVDLDAFNNEVFRYYRLEGDTSATGSIKRYIRNDNDDFWVVTNDRFDISVTYRVTDPLVAPPDIMKVGLLIDGMDGSSPSHWWMLGDDGVWHNNDTSYAIDHDLGAGNNEWITVEIEANPFPANGTVYILLGTGGVGSGEFIDYKAPVINYKPFFSDPLRTYWITIAGVGIGEQIITNPNDTAPKGDYWLTEQDVAILDKIEKEVFISDANRKSIKGALFRGTTSELTTTTWHRDNVTEERHYKELINLSRYNHAYRRMWKSRGVFSGLKWQPSDDTTIFEPLSFHRHFYFPDKAALAGKYFMITPPLVIHHDSGMFDGTFVECLDTGLVEGETGATPEAVAHQLAVLINLVTPAEWDSEGGAPPPGTNWFPPSANAIGVSLLIILNVSDTPTGSAADGGAGNSPSLTQGTNAIIFSKRVIEFVVGPDVQPGNTFTISIYGHEVTFISGSVTEYQDGNQEGDIHNYSIAFK